MSMSQEEIEALMSGAGDVALDEEEVSSQEDSTPKDEESIVEDTESSDEEAAANEEEKEADTTESTEPVEEPEKVEEIPEDNSDNIDDILAGIDGIVDDGPSEDSKKEEENDSQNMEELIDQNQYPLPVKNENKVVNQLNQVADDSEEKASQIFDVLSFILDENNEISNYNKSMGEFIQRQTKLLTALSTKFPNIKVFQTNLEIANELIEASNNLSSKVDAENNKVFEAMELMQFHDINRQKIERVMAVIKKLNSYLNGIFEDDEARTEVQIAKHISGDSNEIVDADDLESLITQFSQEGQ
jgi:hypothetical protein